MKKLYHYKNTKRNETENVSKYVPQYKQLGIEPVDFKSAVVPENTPIVKVPNTNSNPRTRTLPYAAPAESPIGVGRGVVPNVGNNMEHTWSSVDGQIVDDLSQEYQTSPDHPMIDNNDYVTDHALDIRNENQFSTLSRDVQVVAENEILPIIDDLEYGSYLLLVDGVAICSGPHSEIEEQVRALIFGEHDICDGVAIDGNRIVVLKKMNMKVGVFLE